MPDFADRIAESAITTGTGNFTLAGALTGFRAFSSAYSAGDEVYYVIQNDSGSQWEVGKGTLVSSTVLARTTVLSSSNSGSLVSFAAGNKRVFVDAPAAVLNSAKNTYIHEQSSASATWTITHNLGKYPSVMIVDSLKRQVIGAVTYTNANVIVLSFTAAFSGQAYLN